MVVVCDTEVILRIYLKLIKFGQAGLLLAKDVGGNYFEDEVQFKWGRIVIPRYSNIIFLTLE